MVQGSRDGLGGSWGGGGGVKWLLSAHLPLVCTESHTRVKTLPSLVLRTWSVKNTVIESNSIRTFSVNLSVTCS